LCPTAHKQHLPHIFCGAVGQKQQITQVSVGPGGTSNSCHTCFVGLWGTSKSLQKQKFTKAKIFVNFKYFVNVCTRL
jgi:hypothetical protein